MRVGVEELILFPDMLFDVRKDLTVVGQQLSSLAMDVDRGHERLKERHQVFPKDLRTVEHIRRQSQVSEALTTDKLGRESWIDDVFRKVLLHLLAHL